MQYTLSVQLNIFVMIINFFMQERANIFYENFDTFS